MSFKLIVLQFVSRIVSFLKIVILSHFSEISYLIVDVQLVHN